MEDYTLDVTVLCDDIRLKHSKYKSKLKNFFTEEGFPKHKISFRNISGTSYKEYLTTNNSRVIIPLNDFVFENILQDIISHKAEITNKPYVESFLHSRIGELSEYYFVVRNGYPDIQKYIFEEGLRKNDEYDVRNTLWFVQARDMNIAFRFFDLLGINDLNIVDIKSISWYWTHYNRSCVRFCTEIGHKVNGTDKEVNKSYIRTRTMFQNIHDVIWIRKIGCCREHWK